MDGIEQELNRIVSKMIQEESGFATKYGSINLTGSDQTGVVRQP